MTIWLHEIIHTVPGQEEPYMASVLSLQFTPERKGEDVRHHATLGQFRSTGTSGIWPKVINIWEHGGWDRLVRNLSQQFTDKARDTEMEDWWNRNLTLRRGGYDRVLLGASFSPDADSLEREGWRGRIFLHEIIKVPWGKRDEYVARLGRDFVPVAAKYGWKLVNASTVAMRPREVFTLFGVQRWGDLARLLEARSSDARLRQWFAYREATVTRSEEMVLQPGRHDRLRLPETPTSPAAGRAAARSRRAVSPSSRRAGRAARR